MNFRLLFISAAAALLPSFALANTNQEMNEGDFLDLVDAKGHITVQGNGVAREFKGKGPMLEPSRDWLLVSRRALLHQAGPRSMQWGF